MIYSSRIHERDSRLRVLLYSQIVAGHLTVGNYHKLTRWLDCYQFITWAKRDFFPRSIHIRDTRDLFVLNEQPTWLTYKEQESLCALIKEFK